MRDSHLPPPPEQGDGRPEASGGQGEEPSERLSPGHLAPIGWATLVVWFLAGIALGWSFHAFADRIGEARPVGWLQAAALWFLAAGLAAVGLSTRRAVLQVGQMLDPERMVNRLVLGRACTVAGAFLGGGYLGYAFTWWGSHPDLRVERVGVALVAAAGGIAILLAGKYVEWACRVPGGRAQP